MSARPSPSGSSMAVLGAGAVTSVGNSLRATTASSRGDSLWFNGQLWLSSDYQLHVWDCHQRRRPQWQGRDVVHSGHMDALDGVLVVAGRGTVHAFDGEDWHVLVWPYPAQGVSAG